MSEQDGQTSVQVPNAGNHHGFVPCSTHTAVGGEPMEDDVGTTFHGKEATLSMKPKPDIFSTSAGGDVEGREAPVAAAGTPETETPARRRGCRDVDEFEILDGALLGEGTYGKVMLARDKETGEKVALKKIRLDYGDLDEGFPTLALREITILKRYKHENIVRLKCMVTDKRTIGEAHRGDVYMCLEYCEYDLNGILDSPAIKLTMQHVRVYMYQLLSGLASLHRRHVLHRDLKAANILITRNQELKIADFGMSKAVKLSTRPLTSQARICTLWYRAPEIMLGSKRYDGRADMWSAGIIMAEMLNGGPIAKYDKEPEHMQWVYELVGTESMDSWDGAKELDGWDMFQPAKRYRGQLRQKWTAPPEALDLLEGLLTLNPEKRLTANEALKSDFFYLGTGGNVPSPSLLDPFKVDSAHELSVRQERRAARQRQQQRLQEQRRERSASRRHREGEPAMHRSSSWASRPSMERVATMSADHSSVPDGTRPSVSVDRGDSIPRPSEERQTEGGSVRRSPSRSESRLSGQSGSQALSQPRPDADGAAAANVRSKSRSVSRSVSRAAPVNRLSGLVMDSGPRKRRRTSAKFPIEQARKRRRLAEEQSQAKAQAAMRHPMRQSPASSVRSLSCSPPAIPPSGRSVLAAQMGGGFRVGVTATTTATTATTTATTTTTGAAAAAAPKVAQVQLPGLQMQLFQVSWDGHQELAVPVMMSGATRLVPLRFVPDVQKVVQNHLAQLGQNGHGSSAATAPAASSASTVTGTSAAPTATPAAAVTTTNVSRGE